MKIKQKRLAGWVGLAVVLFSGFNAFGIALNDSGAANNWLGIWQTGQGGEFYAQTLSGPVNNSAYATTTRNQGIANSFQTFCLEYSEYLGGNGLSYVVNNQAVNGGANIHTPAGTQGGDMLSRGTAWLYSQFAQGTLGSYNFANTGGTRANSASSSAALLQNAIWALEDEIVDPTAGSNMFFDAAVAQFTSSALAQANYTTGEFGVWVLNMTANGTKKQDMLFFAGGASVPDGGSTLILLGLAVGGISLLARRMKLLKAV